MGGKRNRIDLSNLDSGIRNAVQILNDHGFETWESCQGGDGHCFEMPTIRFWGEEFDLIRAYKICENYNLNVFEAHRVYRCVDIGTNSTRSCPNGDMWDIPFNQITFLNHPVTKTIEKPN